MYVEGYEELLFCDMRSSFFCERDSVISVVLGALGILAFQSNSDPHLVWQPVHVLMLQILFPLWRH